MTESSSTQHMNQVVECLLDQEKSKLKKESSSIKREASQSIKRQSSENIINLYQNTNDLLGQFDDHFTRCKKYNQAKIHRKYEIIITDLQKQNNDLKKKIYLELSARPSSQKYVSDLIDKMIELQNMNQSLLRQNENLTNLVVNYEKKYEMVMTSPKAESEEENPESKETLKKQWQKMLIKDTVKQFILNKKEEKMTQHLPETTIFEKFLEFNKAKFQKWNLHHFFQSIDKWTINLKDSRHLDKIKIRNRIEGSLSKASEDQSSSFVLRTLKDYKTVEGGTSQTTNVQLTPLNRRGNIRERGKDTSFRFRSLYKSQRKIEADPIQ